MKNIRLISLKQNVEKPTVGDICLNYTHGLFYWTQKHEEVNAFEELVEYHNTKVVKIAAVSTDNRKNYEIGDTVVTSRWKLQTISEKYSEHLTYRCEDDNHLFDYYNFHTLIKEDITSLKNRVYHHNENDEYVHSTLEDISLDEIIKLMNKGISKGEANISVETVADEIKWVDNMLIVNKYI